MFKWNLRSPFLLYKRYVCVIFTQKKVKSIRLLCKYYAKSFVDN